VTTLRIGVTVVHVRDHLNHDNVDSVIINVTPPARIAFVNGPFEVQVGFTPSVLHIETIDSLCLTWCLCSRYQVNRSIDTWVRVEDARGRPFANCTMLNISSSTHPLYFLPGSAVPESTAQFALPGLQGPAAVVMAPGAFTIVCSDTDLCCLYG